MINWKYFSDLAQKTGFDISCKLSPWKTVCMKYQNPISGKNKKNISMCCLLKILPRVLSINSIFILKTEVGRRSVGNKANRPCMQKSVLGHMRIGKAQISLHIHTVRSGPSLFTRRIIGYYRMYEWRAKARMILCAYPGWSECTFCVFRRHFFHS